MIILVLFSIFLLVTATDICPGRNLTGPFTMDIFPTRELPYTDTQYSPSPTYSCEGSDDCRYAAGGPGIYRILEF